MTRRLAVAAAVVALVASGAWLALRPANAPDAQQASPPAAAAGASRGGAAAPSIVERAEATSALAMTRPQEPVRRTLFGEYLASPQYLALYERLKATPEGETPQGRLVMYEILRECATVNGGVPWPFAPRRWNQPKRDEFIAGIAGTDPLRERRIAAYDRFNADRCAGLSGVTISQEDLFKLLKDSAAGGEPAARALAVEQDLWAARRASGTRTASPSDQQIGALEEAASSRDPEAIRVAGRVLANGWSDYALRMGTEELPVEPRAFVNAFLVLACEYGAPCGADTPRMLQACALQGHCDAQSFPEYLAYYGSTPHDSTLLMQYRSIIRTAIESGDWSQLRILRGQPQASNRPTFIPGPR
ncbi:MAG TPA: hypothetical protein VFP36_10430 [Usitatibacter sp.]|nr:hypothetical protein [Usitatibacter sp.]